MLYVIFQNLFQTSGYKLIGFEAILEKCSYLDIIFSRSGWQGHLVQVIKIGVQQSLAGGNTPKGKVNK